MTKRICITVPDEVERKLTSYMNTYPNDRRRNVSNYVSGLIAKYTPEILID